MMTWARGKMNNRRPFTMPDKQNPKNATRTERSEAELQSTHDLS